MVITNAGDLRAVAGAGAGTGALVEVIVLLRPCDRTCGVVTAGTARVRVGPRDWLRVQALDCQAARALGVGVLECIRRVVGLPPGRVNGGGDPIDAG
jgi:hypothetical protein